MTLPTPPLHRVEFEPSGRRVDVPAGSSLLVAAHRAGITLASVCGGEGSCGRCRVILPDGERPSPSEADRRALGQHQLDAGERLACRVSIGGRMRVEVPRASLLSGPQLQVLGPTSQAALDPAVRALSVAVERPTIHDARSDLERVAEAVAGAHTLPDLQADPVVLRQLTPRLRESGWQVQLLVREQELVGVLPPGERPLGVAIDVGTTKIAAYLVDLVDGRQLAAAATPNPQAAFGADVISRLAHATRGPDGADELASTIRGALDELIGRLCTTAGARRDEVADGCIVGNTAMHHLLLGLPVHQLARAPFVASTSAALDVRARDLGLDVAPDARVHVLPGIGGFVGADHVAMILGADLDRVEAVKVGVDIGTNTEVVLRLTHSERLSVTSCASGPAFEGAHIRDGMQASHGAIDRVEWDEAGQARIHTIDEGPALGICGSGILDALAGLARTGRMDAGGRLQAGSHGMRRGDQGLEFLLVAAADSGHGREIVITQSDVNQIQLAKGAIAAGIAILLEVSETDPADVEEVVLAGAFGSYLNLDSALEIGLLPHLPRASCVQIGNAAGTGARAALVSRGERQRARAIAHQADYVELTAQPGFRRRFATAMRFPRPSTDGDRH